jgi:phage terminase large subunit-like protein
LYDDDSTGSPQVPIIATTITQAIRSCYGVAASMIKSEPELERRALIYTGIAQPRVVTPFNEGELFPISNDTDGLQGLDPSLGIVDEIGFQPEDSWQSLRLASGKRERSLIVGLGTPGLDRENALFKLRTAIRESGGVKGIVFHEHAAPDGCDHKDPAVWRAANPAMRAGFLRSSVLEGEALTTPEGHFRIFRLGQWYEGVDSWLGPNGRIIWEALTNPYDLVDDAPTWVGVDIGLKRDSSAVVAIQQRDDGRFHALCRIWAPTPDVPVDTTDIMGYLRDLDDLYDLKAVSYDPRFFDVPAKTLSDEGLPMLEIPQSVERMSPACGDLLEAIVKGQLTHDGDDVFATHVLNAVARINERGFTLSKGKSRGRIDAVIALALAFAQARVPTVKAKEPYVRWA